MKRTLSYIYLCCCLLMALPSMGQVQVQAATDTRSILIGDQFRVKVTVSFPVTEPVAFAMVDSIPHFEILEKEKTDTTEQAGRTILSQELLLTSFDSGQWVIPPFSVQKGELEYRSDSIPMLVTYSPVTPEEYHDIKEIEEVEGDINWVFWISGILSLIALVLIFLWWRRNRSRHPAIQRYEHLGPYEEAMKLLDDLEAADVPVKERYTRLTYIFRIFLKRKLRWNAFGKTTYDILVGLESSALNREEYTSLGQTLRLCNLVKFAKYEPDPEEHRPHISAIRNIIESLNKE